MKKGKPQKSAVIACIITGLVFRLAYCIFYPVQPRDAYVYYELIVQWEKTGKITDQIAILPLSLWILKIPKHYFQYDIIKGAELVNITIGLTIIIITQRMIFRLIKDNGISLFIGLFAATHPTLIKLSCSCLRENTYLLFALLSIDFMIKYILHMKTRHIIITSAMSAMAFMCRLEGGEIVLYVFFVLVSLCLFKRIKPLIAVRDFIVYLLFFSITFFGIYYSLHFDDIIIRPDLIMQKSPIHTW